MLKNTVAREGLKCLVRMLMKLKHLVVECFIIRTILLTRLHKICTNHVTGEAGQKNVIYNKDSVSIATSGIMKRAGFSMYAFLYSL